MRAIPEAPALVLHRERLHGRRTGTRMINIVNRSGYAVHAVFILGE